MALLPRLIRAAVLDIWTTSKIVTFYSLQFQINISKFVQTVTKSTPTRIGKCSLLSGVRPIGSSPIQTFYSLKNLNQSPPDANAPVANAGC